MTDKDNNTVSTPLEMLNDMMTGAPPAVQAIMNDAIADMMALQIPRLAQLAMGGHIIGAEELDESNIAEAFMSSLDNMHEAGLELPRGLTATVRSAGEELGDFLNKVVKRVLITHTEDYVNRMAYYDLMAGHAMIVRGLVELPNVEPGLADDNDA